MSSVTNRSSEATEHATYIDNRPEYRFVKRQPASRSHRGWSPLGRSGPAIRLPDRIPSWLLTAPRTLLMLGVLAALGLLAANALTTRSDSTVTGTTEAGNTDTSNTETSGQQQDAGQTAQDRSLVGPQGETPLTNDRSGPVTGSRPAPSAGTVSATTSSDQDLQAATGSEQPAAVPTEGWSTVARFDFGPVGAEVADGFVGVTPLTAGPLSLTGGPLSADNLADTQADRSAADPLTRDGISSTGIRNFHKELGDGVYRLQITMGSATTTHDAMAVSVNGAVAGSDLDTDVGEFLTVVHEVTVRDGNVTVTFTDRGGDDGVWAVAGLIIEAAD